MATSNSRDVPLTLSVTTVGKESVKELANEVQALAKQGGAAAPEFEKLATEINKLANQSELVQKTRELVTEIDRLAVVEAEASAKAQVLKVELGQLTEVTTKSAVSERDAKQALLEAQSALFDKRQALATLKNETTAAEKESSRYTNSVKELNTQIIQGKGEVRELGIAYRESKAATTEAEAAERSLARSLKESSTEAGSARVSIDARNQALREAGTALAETGIVTRDVAAAEVQLAKSYIETVAAVDQARVARDKAAADALAAAAEEKAALERKKADTIAYANLVDVLNAKIANSNREAARSANDAAEASAKSARELSDAFGTVGVRSVETLRNEITKIKSALETLQAEGRLTGAELAGAFASGQGKIQALETEIRGLTGELTRAERVAGFFKTTMGQFTAGNIIANQIQNLASRVFDLGKSFVGANVELETLSRGLKAIYGDSTTAAKQIDFLRDASQKAGVSMSSISDAFIRFAASTKTSNIPIAQTNELFLNLSVAAGTLGLSSDKTSRALEALSQIASKGTVSLEELRGQLSEAVPGALSLTAKGLGVTDAQLIKLVESGNLAARDMLPAFSKGLTGLTGEVTGLVPTFERFKNALTAISQGVLGTFVIETLTGLLKVLGGLLGTVALGASVLAETIGGLARASGVLVGAVTTLTNPLTALKEIFTDSADRLAKQNEQLNIFIDGAEGAGVAATTLGAAQNGLAASTGATTKATDAFALAQQLAGNNSFSTSEKLVQLSVAIAANLETQKAAIETAEKSAKATKEQGEAVTKLTELEGNAEKAIIASATSAESYSAALNKVVAERQRETDLLSLQLEATTKANLARGDSATKVAEETQKLQDKLKTSQAELDQSKASAFAAELEARARTLASGALKDQSAQVAAYGAAVKATAQEVARLQAADDNSLSGQQALTAARIRHASAVYNYNDALKDSITKIELETRANSAALQLSIALASASQTHYESLAREARSRGDLVTAVNYEVQAKDQAIKQLKLKLELDRLQNAASMIELETKRKLIDASTDEGRAKQKVIDIELQILKVRAVSSESIKDQIRNLELERNAIRDGTSARQAGGGGISSDTSLRIANAGAINMQADALRTLTAVQEKYSRPSSSYDKKSQSSPFGLTSDGLTANKDGSAAGTYNAIGANGELYALAEKQRNGTLTAADLATAKAAFTNASLGADFLQSMLSVSAGSVSVAALNSSNADKIKAQQILESVQNLANQPASTPGSQQSGSFTVNVNMGGTQQSIQVASRQDADTLTRTLQQLGNASLRSS